MTKFIDGSPVTDTSNPFNNGAGLQPEDILPSLDVEAVESLAMSNLDAYGSSPVTGESAVGRPANPPTIGGDDANP